MFVYNKIKKIFEIVIEWRIKNYNYVCLYIILINCLLNMILIINLIYFLRKEIRVNIKDKFIILLL